MMRLAMGLSPFQPPAADYQQRSVSIVCRAMRGPHPLTHEMLMSFPGFQGGTASGPVYDSTIPFSDAREKGKLQYATIRKN
jgi:hypothetical protein